MLRQTHPPASSIGIERNEDPPRVASASFMSEVSARFPAQAPEDVDHGERALEAKLSRFVRLGAAETDALRQLGRAVHNVSANQVLIHEGIRIDHVCLLLDGMACRYKMLPGGERQILGYLIPGDIFDAHFIVFNRPDHSVAALCNSKIATIPIVRLAATIRKYPRLATAFACSALVDSAILREWLLNVGQRHAEQRLAHLICELQARLKIVHRVSKDGSFDLPIDQVTLADTIGLTLVHTNRILQRLRKAELICLRQRRVTILDYPRLVFLAGFDENHLHLLLQEI